MERPNSCYKIPHSYLNPKNLSSAVTDVSKTITTDQIQVSYSLEQSGKSMFDFSGDFAAAETGVFWDIEDCKIPDDLNAGADHHGPVSIRAYGDMTGHDFPSEGVKLNHFPAGERYARHTKMLEDIISWSAEHQI